MTSPGFQTQVYNIQAPGVEGDYADHNPRTTVDAGPGGLVAGAAGVTIGRFAWMDASRIDPMNAPVLCNNFGLGAPDGFVHREQQGLITAFLTASGMVIPAGIMVTLHQHGGFFVINRGTTYAQLNHKAYARLSDGAVAFGVTATPPGQASVTGSVAASTFSVTGSITGNVMTVTVVGSGTVVPGATLSGTGVASGTKVLSQILPLLTGEATGGIGRYAVSIAEHAATSTTISGTYGTMTVTVVGSGTVSVGGVITAGGGGNTASVAGTTVRALGTGAGLTGTYIVDNNTVVTSGTLALSTFVETKWFATSAGAAGELIKMSSWPLG